MSAAATQILPGGLQSAPPTQVVQFRKQPKSPDLLLRLEKKQSEDPNLRND